MAFRTAASFSRRTSRVRTTRLCCSKVGYGDAKIVQQISFRVDSVDDVLRYYRCFKQVGVSVDSQVSHGGGVSCYFRDPEGNRLEVFADVDTQGKPGYSGPLDLEKSAEQLIAKVRSGPDPAMAGHQSNGI